MKILYIISGFTFVSLAAIGTVFPVLPTTPFLLLAAFFFSKGSPRWHAWLLRNRIFGPLLKDWQEGGVIRLRAKIAATTLMLVLYLVLLFLFDLHLGLEIAVGAIEALVLLFLWTRPSTAPLAEEESAGGDLLP